MSVFRPSPIDIRGAFVRRTNLSGANFTRANLSGADARYAIFRGANFKEAILKGTDLRGSDLFGARNLTIQQLQQAIVDEETVLPVGISLSDVIAARSVA